MFNVSSSLKLIKVLNLNKISNLITVFNLSTRFNLDKIFNFIKMFNFRSRSCHYLEINLCDDIDSVSIPKIIYIIF